MLQGYNTCMLLREEILMYLSALNDELASQHITGEMCLFGGTVMCVVYQARPSTKDVDAIFVPSQAMRQAAEQVAKQYDLREDWLNDAVKGFVVPHQQHIFLDLTHLKVYIPDPTYLLAMKALAARFDTQDGQDLRFLIQYLNITTADAVFDVLENYYPRRQIKPATRYFIEEIFDATNTA